MAQFRFDRFRRQQALGTEAHHQDERESEEHVFPVTGRGKDVVGADELVRFKEVGESFDKDRVEA